jgi:hypothetical protein
VGTTSIRKLRYKLKGTVRWCLNLKGGWISYNHWIIRWNNNYIFDKREPYTLISLTKVKVSA